MKLRPLALAPTVLLMAPPLVAQTHHQSQLHPVPGPIKHGGAYDLATGTWHRNLQATRSFGSLETLYSNTAFSGYFLGVIGPGGAAEGGSIIDEGVIPPSGDPSPFMVGPGRNTSAIERVTIGYCDIGGTPGLAEWTVRFYESYSPCTYPPDPGALILSATIAGAPANGCWMVDVMVPPAVIRHGADGLHDGLAPLDSFGIEVLYTGAGNASVGPILAGDPVVTDSGWIPGVSFPWPTTGSNTYYGEVGGCPGTGSGYRNLDGLWIEDIAGTGNLPMGSGCYDFGPYWNNGTPCEGPLRRTYAGLSIEIAGTAAPDPPRVISDPRCTGAPYASTGAPGEIVVTGSVFHTDNNARLEASGLPRNEFGLFATGLVPSPRIPVGNGWLCIDPASGGGVGRFQMPFQIKNSGSTGTMSLDTVAGEWRLTDIPTAMGTYAATTGITTYFTCWHRESGVGAGSNLTGSCSVLWR